MVDIYRRKTKIRYFCSGWGVGVLVVWEPDKKKKRCPLLLCPLLLCPLLLCPLLPAHVLLNKDAGADVLA